ncbi:flagellar hook-associated protein FlgK [Amphibiibacter pelophylacis]|uniref:Flagellar hook-associated protein FlgK n=1 Tax=Amphibiibacter pelophylacis TaxID=1799477 RepID=A0ACC6P4P9_9BURK
MAVSTLISTGLSGLQTNRLALDVVGHNVANELTPGYSWQDATRVTSMYQNLGSGYVGTGVQVQTVVRAFDGFLNQQSLRSAAIAKREDARSTQMQRLETSFPLGASNLGAAAEGFLNSMTDVANSPADPSARQVAMSSLQEFGNRLASVNDQFTALQDGITEQVKNSLTQVNTLASQLARVNQTIMAAPNPSQTPNDLLDQRDQLVRQINDMVKVSTVYDTRGAVSLFVGSGQSLVTPDSSREMTLGRDPYDPSRVQVGIINGGVRQTIPSDYLGGGSLAGLLSFQDKDLMTARAQVGQVAAVFAKAVNTQQALGVDANGQPGKDLVLGVDNAPVALPSRFNTAAGTTVAVKITDAYQLQPTDYRVATSTTAGQYEVTRLSDGSRQTLTAAAGKLTFEGLEVTVGGTAPNAGDSFLVQAASRIPGQVRTPSLNGSLLAAAAPITVATDNANLGTLALTGVQSSGTAAAAVWTFSTTGATTPGAQGRFTSSTGGSADWVPGQPVKVGNVIVQFDGVPENNDKINLAPTAAGQVNNANAQAFVDLRTANVLGRDATGQGGVSISDGYARALSRVGSQAAQAKTSAQVSASTARSAETARTNFSGVNMDEEAAKLLTFQQSYQASAKVLQVAQNVMDTLLSLTSP